MKNDTTVCIEEEIGKTLKSKFNTIGDFLAGLTENLMIPGIALWLGIYILKTFVN